MHRTRSWHFGAPLTSYRTGFTLIELLVTVSIIALLVGITLPALMSAHDSARLASCASSLRQMALVMKVYENDSRGFLPRTQDPSYGQAFASTNPGTPLTKTWIDHLTKLGFIEGRLSEQGLPETLRCPEGRDLDNDPTWAGHMPHFGMNYFLSPPAANEASLGRKSFGGRPDRAVGSPSTKIFLVETRHLSNPRGWFSAGNQNWTALRHSGGKVVNIMYLDGSCRAAKPSKPAPTSPSDVTHPLASIYFVNQLTDGPGSW